MRRSQAGQATIEWSALLLALGACPRGAHGRGRENGRVGPRGAHRACAGVRGRRRLRGAGLARPRLRRGAGRGGALRMRPNVVYERSSAALPIDFRRCRETGCSDGPDAARAIDRSASGLPVTAFTRVVDRRRDGGCPLPPVLVLLPGELHRWHRADLRRRMAGLPSRTTGRATRCGSHRAERIAARATAHGEYSSDWSTSGGWYRVSGGSHAGQLVGRRAGRARDARGVQLDAGAARAPRPTGRYTFAVTPPWRKEVYTRPESASS